MSEHDAMWQLWGDVGLEHLRLVESENGAIADSRILRLSENLPIRLQYEIRVDAAWRVRTADIVLWSPDRHALQLRSNGLGHWTDGAGDCLSQLDGCLDIDLTVTPFTNTLPIRRIGLEPGDSEEISVAYITLPNLCVALERQRYTFLERLPEGGRYRYEGLSTGFTTELQVDSAGLVGDYPGMFRRVPIPAKRPEHE